MSNMKIKLVNIGDIKPYFNNPRKNVNAIAPVASSIRKFGFTKPLIVDKDGVIIAGHTRYLAAFQMNLEKIPVIYSDMDEEQAKMFRIADNKLAEKSSYNEEKLIEELKALSIPDDMQDFFFENLDSILHPIDFSAQMPTSMDFDPTENVTDASDDADDYGEGNENYYTPQSGTDGNPSNDEYGDNDNGAGEDENDSFGGGSSAPTIDYSFLYKPYLDEDGHRKMKVLCPYCYNIETVTLE